ncbi:MAG: ABC transporter permease [Bdellovibrionota bacterium]
MSAMTEQLLTAKDTLSLMSQTLRRTFQWPWRWPEILKACVSIGIGSLPVITIATAFAGMVVTTEMAWHMDQALHTVSMVPGFTGQFIFRELGIAVPALLLVAKVGASITAEVGSMKVTEQIDALKLLRIDPVNYLVFPRFIAAVISGACLTIVASAVTLAFAMLIAITRFNFSVMEYVNALRHFITYRDLICAVVKGMIFGGVIPLISCAYAFRCEGGAEGVGTATTNSVVASTITVITLDFVLTYIFTWIL